MNELDPKVPVVTSTTVPTANEEHEALRHLIVSTLVLMLVISGTLNLFFWREYKTTKRDLAAYQPGATQMITDYEKNRRSAIDEFLRKLTAYGQTHKDFEPIVLKYGLKSAATNAVAAPSAPSPSGKK